MGARLRRRLQIAGILMTGPVLAGAAVEAADWHQYRGRAPRRARSRRSSPDMKRPSVAESIRAIETLRKTGTYVYNGLEHPLRVYQVRDVGAREEIDGLTQWGTSTKRGKKTVRIARDDEAWIRQESESAEIRPIEGRAEIEGVDTDHLRLTLADGEIQDWYLDADSHLLVKRARKLPEDDYQSPRAWFYDDWREVAGVMMPFFVQLEENLFAREYLFDTVEVNVPVDESLLAAPPAP